MDDGERVGPATGRRWAPMRAALKGDRIPMDGVSRVLRADVKAKWHGHFVRRNIQNFWRDEEVRYRERQLGKALLGRPESIGAVDLRGCRTEAKPKHPLAARRVPTAVHSLFELRGSRC